MVLSEMVRDAAARVPEARLMEGAFSTEAFLIELVELPPLDREAHYRLDRLCKKVDVVGQVRVFYRPDLARSVAKDKLNDAFLELFAAILLHYARQSGNPKFLNTVLKLADGRRSHNPIPESYRSVAMGLVEGFCQGIPHANA